MSAQGSSSVASHEANRLSWNAATKQHHSHKPELMEEYVVGKKCNLFDDDIRMLTECITPGVSTVVHLQCNDGQDTVSIANRFAPRLTIGVDISDEAIAFASDLGKAAAVGKEMSFQRGDVFEWCEANGNSVDVVYTGYGALCWISNVTRWASSIAHCLKPKGRLVVIEFHPLLGALAINSTNTFVIERDCIGGAEDATDGVGDYVGNDFEGCFKNPHPAFEYSWSVGEVVTALLASGLVVVELTEYPYVNAYQALPSLVLCSDENCERQKFTTPTGTPKFPMMFSIVVEKP